MHTLFEFVTYTKSVEYVIAVGFLLAFVGFWRYLNAAPREAAVAAAAPSLGARLADYVGGFLLPDSVRYHPGHAWARDDGDLVTVGVDDFGQKLVGKIDGLELPAVGRRLAGGEQAWTLAAGGRNLTMLAPIGGEVVAVNNVAAESPQLVNQDPFGRGWLLKLRAPAKTAALKGLLSGELAKRWLEDARARLLADPRHELGYVLADAGPARDGLARALDEARWAQIVAEFFLTAEDGDETRANP
jgi:glycine cleavage system H protein